MEITIQTDTEKSGRGTRYVTHTFDLNLETMIEIMTLSHTLKKAGKTSITYKKILAKAITEFIKQLEAGGMLMEPLPKEIVERTLQKAKNIQEGMKKSIPEKVKPSINLSWAD